MDNQVTVRELLESFDEVTIDEEISEREFLISLFEKQFLFIAPTKEPDSDIRVLLYNDSGLDIPHILLREMTGLKSWPEGRYRWVCLYEQESVVNSITLFEDKVIDAIERLIKLLSLNEIEKEREFKKEFMFFWNTCSVGETRFNVYLRNENVESELDIYYGETCARIIDRTLQLSDIDSRNKDKRIWVRHVENGVFFIPIVDFRGIIPPHRGYSWSSNDIKNIVYAHQIKHIDTHTFEWIKTMVPKTQNVVLVFGIQKLSGNVFAVRINCKNEKRHTLLEKILEDIVSVEPLYTTRKDYLFLNEQIGNDIGLMNKKVLLIGAGSLGSYVAFELVKNGASHLKIYDGDRLHDENILRWVYGGIGTGAYKATTISILLNLLHPEIDVKALDKNIEEDVLVKEESSADLIIFTIGNSDAQLRFNRALSNAKCSAPVIFTWLEAGGIHSHILSVNYQTQGCFECLYTDENGHAVNNRSRRNPDKRFERTMIRNCCGGTRAAYGSAILLRTTAALLDTIRKVISNEISNSVLIDIYPDSVKVSDTKFPEELCACCGDRKSK